MPDIHISVREKLAQQEDTTVYVCGSGDYRVVFDFDEEWDPEGMKTARFQTENVFEDVLFYGSSCPVPVIGYARRLEVGVYAQNVRTTTPARVALREGVRSRWGPPEDPAPSLYDQLAQAIADTGLKLEELTDGVLLTVRFRGAEQRAFLRHSEVYVGTGDMPPGYRVQLDVTQSPPMLRVRDLEGNLFPIPSIRGEKGEKGDKGDPGPPGPKGDLGEMVIKSINGVAPDESGNVVLTARELGAVQKTGDTMSGTLAMGKNRIRDLAYPDSATDAATKGYVDTRKLVLKTKMLTTGWKGSGPYVQQLYMPEMNPNDTPFVIAEYDAQVEIALAQREAWACVDKVEAMDSVLRITCLEEKPRTEVPLRVILHR